MYQLDFTYDAAAASWDAEFSNARVHIPWRYEVQAEALTGTLFQYPSKAIGRTVVATRKKATG